MSRQWHHWRFIWCQKSVPWGSIKYRKYWLKHNVIQYKLNPSNAPWGGTPFKCTLSIVWVQTWASRIQFQSWDTLIAFMPASTIHKGGSVNLELGCSRKCHGIITSFTVRFVEYFDFPLILPKALAFIYIYIYAPADVRYQYKIVSCYAMWSVIVHVTMNP